jgi:hypothetical protein
VDWESTELRESGHAQKTKTRSHGGEGKDKYGHGAIEGVKRNLRQLTLKRQTATKEFQETRFPTGTLI